MSRLQRKDLFFKELPKLYRTYSSDPEQRPRIIEDVKKHYDFIIVGEKNAFVYLLSFIKILELQGAFAPELLVPRFARIQCQLHPLSLLFAPFVTVSPTHCQC